ncbi:protein-disulfide reductase DsbD [Moritella sp. F3]|uniref:protein-disulfide reductase DsbD family protein n=1 Tax=Moritella sp. F3 TaxID=2718882 RepID=UPI0018E13825|nr:protein-disulfide reductase DsbD domain-containing protein [Moritella sp. F3]GIC75730.1 suppressor for copper-sensitivity B [Moritella sp. F1]GIC81822.1 suppressor for copper-sensitivity B [Moritella sp. F3]
MKIIKALFVTCLLFISTSISAQTTGWLQDPSHPPIQLRFMLTGQVDKTNNTVPAVLEVKLSGDWKTYWRSPGEGGIAPSIDWKNSSNLVNSDWQWPVPKHFSLLGLETYGYTDTVSFPMQLRFEDIHKPLELAGTLTLSSCTTICVLTDYDINMSVDINNLQADAEAMFLYNKSIVEVPKKVDDNNAIELLWDQQKSQLQAKVSGYDWTGTPTLLIDGDLDTSFKLVAVDQVADTITAVFDASSWLGKVELIDKPLNLTVIDSEQALEFSTPVIAGFVTVTGESLIGIVLFALLGGLILNIMPCVLPVLGMKLSTIIDAPRVEKGKIRQQFFASAAGIIVSFWLLASFIFVLKVSGQAIGWGIQFQSPWFIAVMVVITAVFSLNMLGAFEFSLSSNVQTKLATAGDDSNRGHFLQGMFATLLATPCSAPFLGTAVAYAFGADTLSLFVIFTALAIGMALPWLLVATFPSLVSLLPKPGRWMGSVKTVFSGLLMLTCLWLVTLLSSFLPTLVIYGVFSVVSLIFIGFMIKLKGKRAVLISVSVGLLIGSAVALAASLTTSKWSNGLPEDLAWQELDTVRIEQEVQAGKTVFVNITADWCITCKANKIGVILQDPVYSKLQSENIVPMEGDWTVRSEKVTNYLQNNGRFGVPFNIVYGPKAPNGIPLPVILTDDAVMNAIKRASGE